VSFGDGGGVLQLEEGTWEVRRSPKGMGNGAQWSSPRGGEWRGGVKTVLRWQSGRLARTRGRGQRGGGRRGAHDVLEKEEEREKKKGAGGVGDVFYRRGRGRRGGPMRSPLGRETRAERGGASAVVGGRHRPMADGHGRARMRCGAEQGRRGH
jgi:hypothetical protein